MKKSKMKTIKNKIINKLSNVKSLIFNNLSDLFVFMALVIIAINSASINFQFGMYVISIELILLAYLINRKEK